jgi:hypothetical protein
MEESGIDEPEVGSIVEVINLVILTAKTFQDYY